MPGTSGNTLRPRERDALVGLRRRRAEPLPEPAERRSIRAGANITVEELASTLGVSGATIYAWELGIRRPGQKVRDRYAEALRVLAGEAE